MEHRHHRKWQITIRSGEGVELIRTVTSPLLFKKIRSQDGGEDRSLDCTVLLLLNTALVVDSGHGAELDGRGLLDVGADGIAALVLIGGSGSGRVLRGEDVLQLANDANLKGEKKITLQFDYSAILLVFSFIALQFYFSSMLLIFVSILYMLNVGY